MSGRRTEPGVQAGIEWAALFFGEHGGQSGEVGLL